MLPGILSKTPKFSVARPQFYVPAALQFQHGCTTPHTSSPPCGSHPPTASVQYAQYLYSDIDLSSPEASPVMYTRGMGSVPQTMPDLSVPSHQLLRVPPFEITEENMEDSFGKKMAAGRMHLQNDETTQKSDNWDMEPAEQCTVNVHVERIRPDMQDGEQHEPQLNVNDPEGEVRPDMLACEKQDPELHVDCPKGENFDQQPQPTKVADNLMHDGDNLHPADNQEQPPATCTEAQLQDTSSEVVQESMRYADPQESGRLPSASRAEISKLKKRE